ncbi:hypothetical protein [Hoeflea sp.]|uniref:SGNH/GDSL hydrolase family protein n=1 Tax=Hoeflea sp. TaxID=1940281 RepID=UPI00199E0D50|nr:hypothetical protein [Hoeflea sp.]MBC7282584.1 hypothetical protein [Hoeflea sp.]
MIGAMALATAAAGHRRVQGGLAKRTTLYALLGSTAYAAISGAAWGDSITANNQANVMRDSGAGYSEYVNLAYTPAVDTISHGNWPGEVAALTGGTFVNEGAGGQTSDQITARMEAVAASGVNVVSFGTNDASGGSVATQLNLQANVDRVAAHGYGLGTTLFTTFQAKTPGGSSYGIADYARRAGFKSYNWHTGMLKLAHRMHAETAVASLPTSWIEGSAPPAFMSSPTPTGSVDNIHPGSAFSEAHSQEIAAIATAMSGGAPYLQMQTMAVDWSVPAGTLIGTLDTIGTVSGSAVNNDFGNVGAITVSGANVYRGAGAAPSGDWAEFFIEVRNAQGSNVNRLMLGLASGGTTFRPCAPVIQSFIAGSSTEGTISIVVAKITSANSRFVKVGNCEIQLLTSGQVRFGGPLSSPVASGANVTSYQHFMITWNATSCYTVLGTTYTDRTGTYTGGNINGSLLLFGATTGTTALVSDRTARVGHVYVSDRYFGPGSDISPIWDGANSAISGPADVLAGDAPLYSMAGGPGKFASENYGSLGKLNMWPDWDATNARLRS